MNAWWWPLLAAVPIGAYLKWALMPMRIAVRIGVLKERRDNQSRLAALGDEGAPAGRAGQDAGGLE